MTHTHVMKCFTPWGVQPYRPPRRASGLESDRLHVPQNCPFPQTALVLFCPFPSEKYGADTTGVYDKKTARCSLLADTTRTTGYYAVTAIT